MSEIRTYKLSDRPKWWLPRLFKWLAVLSAGIALITWLLSIWLYSTVFDVMALNGSSEELQSTFTEMSAGVLEETSTLFFETIFIIGFLWLLAIGVDKLDQLVWLNATDEDRFEIIQKRKKKKNAKNK